MKTTWKEEEARKEIKIKRYWVRELGKIAIKNKMIEKKERKKETREEQSRKGKKGGGKGRGT